MKIAALFQNKIKLAGLIIIAGLVIKVIGILYPHPILFLVDLAVSSFLMCAGVVLFLVSFFKTSK